MAVPFRRTSKTTKRMRRTHFKLSLTGVATCSKCGAMIKSHHVCPKCGYYDGKAVITDNAKQEEVVEEKKTKKTKAPKAAKAKTEEKTEKVAKAPKAKKEAKVEVAEEAIKTEE